MFSKQLHFRTLLALKQIAIVNFWFLKILESVCFGRSKFERKRNSTDESSMIPEIASRVFPAKRSFSFSFFFFS